MPHAQFHAQFFVGMVLCDSYSFDSHLPKISPQDYRGKKFNLCGFELRKNTP
jgi:hypothetical protein